MSEKEELLVEKLATLILESRKIIEDRVKYTEKVTEISNLISEATRISGRVRPLWLDEDGNVRIEVADEDDDGYNDVAFLAIHRETINEWLRDPSKAIEKIDEVLTNIKKVKERYEVLLKRANEVLNRLKEIAF